MNTQAKATKTLFLVAMKALYYCVYFESEQTSVDFSDSGVLQPENVRLYSFMKALNSLNSNDIKKVDQIFYESAIKELENKFNNLLKHRAKIYSSLPIEVQDKLQGSYEEFLRLSSKDQYHLVSRYDEVLV